MSSRYRRSSHLPGHVRRGCAHVCTGPASRWCTLPIGRARLTEPYSITGRVVSGRGKAPVAGWSCTVASCATMRPHDGDNEERCARGGAFAAGLRRQGSRPREPATSPRPVRSGRRAGAATDAPGAAGRRQRDRTTHHRAAPPPKLLDQPIERRLYSDRVEASSFLWTDWNKFQENYHPNYILDGDPATAWVEGADSSGAGRVDPDPPLAGRRRQQDPPAASRTATTSRRRSTARTRGSRRWRSSRLPSNTTSRRPSSRTRWSGRR